MAALLWLLLVPLAVLVAIEMAVFSVRPERLESDLQKGDQRAKIVLEYIANPPQFLSCVQVYATAIGLAMGALSTPYLTQPILEALVHNGMEFVTAEVVAFTASLSVVTVVTLIFANLIPKQLGFAHAEEVVLRTAWLSKALVWLIRPLALGIEGMMRVVARWLGIKMSAQQDVTESDITFLLAHGRQTGHLDARESAIVERAFKLSDVPVTREMTPRPQLEWVNLKKPIEPQIEKIAHSFVPVSEGSLDDCLGILKVRDLIGVPHPTAEDVRRRMTEPVRVPETARLLDLVELLRGSAARLALVSDEHGGIVGAISLNDAVEAVLGEMKSLDL